MKKLVLLGLLVAASLSAHSQQIVPLWPHGTPEPSHSTEPETDAAKPTDAHGNILLTNVIIPTMTVYQPAEGKATGTAAIVFPGGGYKHLAWSHEGTETCDWLTSVGVTCLLVKYRIPQPDGMAGHYPADFEDIEDAQQAMRLARSHAADWHIDSNRIGVVGFSAGGNLAVLLCNHPDDHHIESTRAARDIPGYVEEDGGIRFNATPDARPNFAILVYPAYLIDTPDSSTLNPVYAPDKTTPPTFLIQAEDDKIWGRNAAVYYLALDAAKVPAELHMYATGGHGFGIHPAGKPEEHWTHLANLWLRRNGMLPGEDHPQPSAGLRSNSGAMPAGTVPSPCPNPTGAPANQSSQPGRSGSGNPTDNTPCIP